MNRNRTERRSGGILPSATSLLRTRAVSRRATQPEKARDPLAGRDHEGERRLVFLFPPDPTPADLVRVELRMARTVADEPHGAVFVHGQGTGPPRIAGDQDDLPLDVPAL